MCSNELNHDLKIISSWTYKKKMSCNPDKNKQRNAHDPFLFNNISAFWIPVQKPLGLYFGEKINFQHHFKKKK